MADVVCEQEQIAGIFQVSDTANRIEAAQDYFAVVKTRIACAADFWQEIGIDRATDNLIEIDLRTIINSKLPNTWAWCEQSVVNRFIPEEVSAEIGGVSAVFSAFESSCQGITIEKKSCNPAELFFNWQTGKGFVRINASDTISFANRLHEMVWQLVLTDAGGATLSKAKGVLYIEPNASSAVSKSCVSKPNNTANLPQSYSYGDLTGRPIEDSISLAGTRDVEQIFGAAKTIFSLVPVSTDILGIGLTSWWNAISSKFQPNAPMTTYDLRVSFRMKPASLVQLPTIIAEFDISAARDGSRIVAADQARLTSPMFQTVNLYFDVFARSTFFANGGQITLRTVDGDITAINPTLFIKGR